MPSSLSSFTSRKALSTLVQLPTSSLSAWSNGARTTRRRFASVTYNRTLTISSAAETSRVSLARGQVRYTSFKSDKNDLAKPHTHSPQDPLPHASEEAAELEKIMHKDGDANPSTPELEQGTPVSEIFHRDKEARKNMPKVLQDQMRERNGSRSFSTSSPRGQLDLRSAEASDPSAEMVANMIAQATEQVAELHLSEPGLKFSVPKTPLPRTENFRKRYDSLLEQFTKLLMRDGKLSAAQKNMAFILDRLRTAPPPQINPKRRLLPGPPSPQLPLNPVLYLTLIVDSVAPLIKIRQQKGIAGGGASVQIPVPLAQRQRRRTAIKWIIDASDKRRDSKFAQRVANELIAVAEGRSGVWEKREHTHKLGVAGRSNLKLVTRS